MAWVFHSLVKRNLFDLWMMDCEEYLWVSLVFPMIGTYFLSDFCYWSVGSRHLNSDSCQLTWPSSTGFKNRLMALLYFYSVVKSHSPN